MGRTVGAAAVCPDIAKPRIKSVSDQLQAAIAAFTADQKDAAAIREAYDQGATFGDRAVTGHQTDCATVARDLSYLERAPITFVAAPSSPSAAAPAPAVPAPAPLPAAAVPPAAPAVQGVSDTEIKFGMAGPFTGASKSYGLALKTGIATAFAAANETGGVNGRKLTLLTADDGYDPARTVAAMKELYETKGVFGFIANFGTAPAAESVPYALAHRALFYAPYTGAPIVRHDPPDRYVFNYRPSYAEETGSALRYLIKVKRVRPEQIAVFQQEDGFGDAGYDGVLKEARALNPNGPTANFLRLYYPRNTLDMDAAVAGLQQYQRQHNAAPIKAVIMVATTRPAAKFIEKTRDLFPNLIYSNVSAVGSSELAGELMLLGPKFATGVIVTQVTPSPEGFASVVLDYKAALAKYAPDASADSVSLESYLEANILIEALKRAGRQLDTERLVNALETMKNFDMGIGVFVSFTRNDHQAIHKVWGTELDGQGHYQPIDLE
jgi:ABC-type branched-subunit amino acid transport system substrate-binding protein